jgi:hypothetical protein
MSLFPSMQLVLQTKIQIRQEASTGRRMRDSGSGQGMLQRMELVQVGGATACIFGRTYALLDESPEHASVLERLVDLEVTVEYRSQIDLLFFELYPEWKPIRNWFYNQDEELPLSGYVSQREIRQLDGSLILALEMARQLQGQE